MAAFKDLSGKRFGKLVVVGPHPERTGHGMIRWICRCDCGKEKTVTTANIGKNTNSCGCLRNTQGSHSRKHRLWAVFSSMHGRCENPKDKAYENYGGRGIKVCVRWDSFLNFLEDMEATYAPGLSIDRRDNDRNYEPGNCRWATAKEQGRNRRCSINIDTPWGRMNVAEAAERIGMNRERFSTRVKLGWTMDQLFDPKNAAPLTKWDRRRGARSA
jgi:hypothetical protein